MTLWGYIISSTQGSPARLAAFGALCIGGTWLIGEAFARSTTSGFDPKKQKAQMDEMSYDNRRLASAQQQRLSSMLKDIADGRGDDHWNAAMRGTLMPHPQAENKTEAADRERVAQLLASAKR